jgi:Sec7-like guanine-nucleotide exchange factor
MARIAAILRWKGLANYDVHFDTGDSTGLCDISLQRDVVIGQSFRNQLPTLIAFQILRHFSISPQA